MDPIKWQGMSNIRSVLIAKLFTSTYIKQINKDILIDKLTKSQLIFENNYPTIMQILYHLSLKFNKTDYETILSKILTKLNQILLQQPNDNSIFSHFMLSLPYISKIAFDNILQLCTAKDNFQITLGLTCLRDIILHRPPYSDVGLTNLLCFTQDRSEVSNIAIRLLLNKLHPKTKFQGSINSFTITTWYSIKKIRDTFIPKPSQPMMPLNNDELSSRKYKDELTKYQINYSNWITKDKEKRLQWIKQRSNLFLALCTRKTELLNEFMEVYINADNNVKICINELSHNLINYFGNNSGAIIELISKAPKGGELFVEEVATVLTNNCTIKPSQGLLNGIISCYEQTTGAGGNVSVFIPIIKWLPKQMIINLIPSFLNQFSIEKCKTAVSFILNNKDTTNKIDPSELLVTIHNFAPTIDHPHINKIMKLTTYCLGQGPYNKKELTTVIHLLSQQDPIPVLFMRTLIHTLMMYKDLTGFAMSMLGQLIGKKIWNNKPLWDGFERVINMSQPNSYSVLCRLGKNELRSILIKNPELRNGLYYYCTKNKHTLRRYIFDVLDETKPIKKDPNPIKAEPRMLLDIGVSNRTKKRSNNDSNNDNNNDNNKKDDSNETVGYIVEFYLSDFDDEIQDIEGFLKANLANLMQIDIEMIPFITLHKHCINEKIILNTNENVVNLIVMKDGKLNIHKLMKKLSNDIKTLDFSSWKITVKKDKKYGCYTVPINSKQLNNIYSDKKKSYKITNKIVKEYISNKESKKSKKKRQKKRDKRSDGSKKRSNKRRKKDDNNESIKHKNNDNNNAINNDNDIK